MRRALLTANTGPAGTPFSFGNPATSGAAGSTNYVLVDQNGTSPQTGVITSITWYAAGSDAFRLCVGTVSGSTFTVRDFVDITPAGTGSQTQAITLPVQAGDYFAVWSAGSSVAVTTSGNYGYAPSGAAPGSADAFTFTATTGRISLTLNGLA